MDIDAEIERLKAKRIELASKISLTTDFEEKEQLQKDIDRIQAQISFLEKLKKG